MPHPIHTTKNSGSHHSPFDTTNVRWSDSSNSETLPFNSLVRQQRTDSWRLFQSSHADGGGGDDDAREWKAILASFKMYKAAYGNLKIPQRFVVPNMKPWPKAAWGMRLGKIVGSIRGTGKYIEQNPKRRQVLDDLGFVWQVRAGNKQEMASLDQIYTALSIYSEMNGGSVNVPTSFVVPTNDPWPDSVRALPLGRQMSAALPKALATEENAEWRSKFQQIGYPPIPVAVPDPTPAPSKLPMEVSDGGAVTANDLRFQKVYTALKTFKELNGDLLVPQPFVVPQGSTDWPEETWGLRLGARVNAIRSQGTFINKNPERRTLLDDLGFAWNPPRSETRRGRRKATEDEDPASKSSSDATNAQTAQAESSTDDELSSLFDKTFDVKGFDLDDDKSKPSWGFEGGGDLQELARQQAQLERKEEDYAPPRTLQEALDEARARAKEVGIIEGITANNRIIKGKRDKDIPWFNDDFGDDFVFDDVLEALTLYKSFYGDYSNLTLNCDFIVPTPEEKTGFLDDDEDLMSFDVDASARAARAIAEFEEQGDFDSSEDLIAAEIKRLQQEVSGEESEEELETVATQTLLPEIDNNKDWPEHLAGMDLGGIVARIRDGSLEVRHLEERKAKLDALEFDWGDDKYFLDVPFEKAMCAMYAYYLVRGDMFVYENFVMPSEDPWPEALAGYEIGKAVKRIRELQNFMEAYHPEKVSLLRMIDFVWFPNSALSIDPNEPEMDNELLRLTAFGHPDYAKMIDLPMGLPEKIMEGGPYYETDDPKLWWRKWHNWDCVKDYWYETGRRDNAFVLRQAGYNRMADEHEQKYGPGLFRQIEWTMASLAEEGALEKKSLEEKKELLGNLSYYRQEMLGCTDIPVPDRDQMLLDLDDKMLEIMKDQNLDFSAEEEVDDEGTEEEWEESDEEWEYVEDDEGDSESEVDIEIDVEDELGLSQN